MTGYIIQTFHDRVEIASDTAVYKPDGTVIKFRNKVRLADLIPLAVMGSGPTAMIDSISDMILRAAFVTCSVDDTIALVSSALEATRSDMVGDSPFRIAIGAISETSGPTSYLFTMFDEPGVEISKLVEKPRGFGMGCMPDGEELLALGLTLESLETDGPLLFNYMRHTKMPTPSHPDLAPSFKIGGHLDLTVVRPDGVTTKRLRTWPDVIGEKIDPFKAVAAAAA